MSSNNIQNDNQNNNNLNSYFLRTQSTILKGEKIIPFNSLSFKSKYKNKSLSKSKNKTPKKIYGTYTSGNKSLKTKKYINSQNGKNKTNYFASNNPGGIDLNKVSGSSHSSNIQIYKNIKPNENNRFSLYGSNKENGNIDKKEQKKNNYSYYLTNNKNIEKDNNNQNIKIYNSRLYTPFYDLIEKIDKNNSHLNINNKMNNISNNQLLKSNHIIEINDKPHNIIKNHKNNRMNKSKDNIKNKGNNINIHNQKNKNNYNINNNHQLKIQTDNYYLNKPKEENNASIMAKTMEFLNNSKNSYISNNIIYDYNPKNQNNLNSYINNENINLKNNYNSNLQRKNELISSNKNQDNKILTYYINTNKNIKNKNECLNKNTINNMIEELNYSIKKNNRNKNNEINQKYEVGSYNENYLGNTSKLNINSNNYNISLSKNKSFCKYDSYVNLNLNNNNNDINSKYFLKSVFDENLTTKFANDFTNSFSPLKRNIKLFSFSNFDFSNKNKEKELEKIHTPRSYFNIQKSEKKLNQLLQTIPTHKKENKIDEFNNLFSKLFNINANSNRKGKTFGEIDNIMPPNILIYQNNNN